MKVAIVGAGISGSTILRRLLESGHSSADLVIDVYDPREELVVGFPYDEEVPGAIMNEHAYDLSIFSEKPQDFIDWLTKEQPDWADDDAFVPRTYYGEYLKDRLLAYYTYPNVRVIQQRVINMEVEHQHYRLHTLDGELSEEYDAVFFTIGHPPYADRYQLKDTPAFIQNPYPIFHKLSHFSPSTRLAIVGSGLTGMDVMNYLLSNFEWDEPIRCFVPSEPFKTVKYTRYKGPLTFSFSEDWLEVRQSKPTAHIPLEAIVEQFFSDLEANGIDFEELIKKYGTGSLEEIRMALDHKDEELIKLRLYIVKLTAFLPDLYNALTPSDRDLYTEKYEETFNHFRSQMPASSLENMINWVDEGRLDIISGIQDIIYENGAYNISVEDDTKYTADYIINAAGFQKNLSQAAKYDPLLQNLYDQEILTPYYRGGIMVSWPECQIVSNKQGILKQAYLLGHWISGIHYGNNNIHLCIKQAERVADHYLSTL